MTWIRRLGWLALTIATLAIAAAVYVVRLPEPKAAIVIDHVTLTSGAKAGTQINLPYTLLPIAYGRKENLRYRADFSLSTSPETGLFLLIPALNRRTALTLNGQPLFDSAISTLWSGPMLGTSLFVQLPDILLAKGHNELEVEVDIGPFIMPAYLSRIYLGSEASLASSFRLRTWLEQRVKTTALVTHIFLGLGIIFAFVCRPKDRLFGWLAAMVAVSLSISIVFFAGFQPELQFILPYAAAFVPVLGFLALGVACVLVRLEPPRSIRIASIAVPPILMVLMAFQSLRVTLTVGGITILIGALVAATALIAWTSLRTSNIDARLMLAPYFLLTWFLIRDSIVVLFLTDKSPILVAPYGRPLILVAVILVLMRRLAATLGDLDRANENLNMKLAVREAELAELHRTEAVEAARRVREQERERLTSDLHDGISGHLVSIIAMSERSGEAVKPIEQAARAALDDLRLVIYSLDLGDCELPLALANFRERLIPQLQRIGVALDWSTANLPEVSGVTPANALSILRILQEAITNAVKHGPARRIAVRGAPVGMDRLEITVENDGNSLVPGKRGRGLQNMRRRAGQLRGEVHIQSLDSGVRLRLVLPCRLPDLLLDPPSAVYDSANAAE